MSRVILVTGSNTGIGYELVKVLASKPEKHTVYLAARNEKAGKEAQAKLNLANVKFVQLDVTDLASINAAKDTIAQAEGKLDVLVHNAGVALMDKPQKASSIDVSLIRTTMETNLFGVINTTQAFLPLLRKAANAAILLNTTDMASNSYQAKEGFIHLAAYNTSKAAANSYIIALAHELKEEGISVNAFTPGFTSTKLNGFGEGGATTEKAAEIMAPWVLSEGEAKGKTGTFWSYKGEWPW